jgi:MFS family permease
LNLTVGIAALYSDKVDRFLGVRKMGIIILFFIAGGYIALAFNLSYVGLFVLFIFYIFRGFATPILKGYINQMTLSEMRATVLSIRNFVIRLMFAAIAPFIGWMNDVYSLQIALLTSAAIIFIPGLLFLVLQFKANPPVQSPSE